MVWVNEDNNSNNKVTQIRRLFALRYKSLKFMACIATPPSLLAMRPSTHMKYAKAILIYSLSSTRYELKTT